MVSGHLKNPATQKWICLYTAFIIYFDDTLEKDASMVREFQQRFLAGRPQENALLDQYAVFVRKAWIHFHPACANLVVTSILDFITGLLIDAENPSIEVHKRAVNYPRWMRTLNGGSRAFAFFIFPPEIPLEVRRYSPSSSAMLTGPLFHSNFSDLLSFYKEELRGETTNQVSLLAQLAGKTKLEALRQLSRGSIERIRRSRDVLSKHSDAYAIYVKHFLPGYVRYYITEKRYKLGDLDLA
ncbi:terpenoid synthase [Athelia psychrophila]|uniref:Terpenoid synthase n=1 Tax=Athelia psychrophila TaxID=1759441 RepID=A0A166FNN1_9AGAM|nr:terpenoid synthase [Fibularhizoctonia sp. CBS 109695]